jgi:hypothetical protein
MNSQDSKEFEMYLNACTDQQVLGVYEKEYAAGRSDYTHLAYIELVRRQLAP